MPSAIGPNAYTTLGLPPDVVAWAALGIGVLALVAACSRRVAVPKRTSLLVAMLALVAGLLSSGYIAFYLRGGPRVIDATSYFLEARALAGGHFAFPIPEPCGSFRGRFLVSPAEHSGALSVIFPPGWPALLALGFLAGAPLCVGPLIAAALVLVTYALARRLFGRRDVALLAATLSALCAALRYHTADTMSHGLCALLLSVAVYAAVRGRGAWPVVAGLSCGWLVATRPVSGVAAALLVAALWLRRPTLRHAAWFVAGTLPGLALLLWHQHAATGEWLASAQYRYYALADGPPGCFRYGFGAGIGCRHEHGDVVKNGLAQGYGLRAALITSLHRVLLNAIDVANCEPLALVMFGGVALGFRRAPIRLLGAAVLLFIVAYAPFYFPASYPGAGARLLSDVLPLEHVLLAWSATRLRVARYMPACALLGFACHVSYAHRALAEREGGRPMFEPELLARAGIERGLVFVNTDHGFNLGYVPGADPARELLVARARGDAHDQLLWERLGRPTSYRYSYAPLKPAAPVVLAPFVPPQSTTFRFEAEAEWPPLEVRGGWVLPDFSGAPCVSGGRGLRLESSGLEPIQLVLSAYVAKPGRYALRTGWQSQQPKVQAVSVAVDGQRWPFDLPAAAGSCWQSPPRTVRLRAGAQRLEVTAKQGGALLDYVELTQLELK